MKNLAGLLLILAAIGVFIFIVITKLEWFLNGLALIGVLCILAALASVGSMFMEDRKCE